MLVVETIAKIRRAHFVEGKSIKQICRELRLSPLSRFPEPLLCKDRRIAFSKRKAFKKSGNISGSSTLGLVVQLRQAQT